MANLGPAHRLAEAVDAADKQLSFIKSQAQELSDEISEHERRSSQGGDDIRSFVEAIREGQVVDNEADAEEIAMMLRRVVTFYEDYVYDVDHFKKQLENVRQQLANLKSLHSDAYGKFRQVRDAY